MRRLLALALLPALASAHPLSRDKYSLRAAIRLEDDRLDAVVVLEVPFQVVMKDLEAALGALKVDAEGRRVAQDVIDAYAQSRFDLLARSLTLTIDGRTVTGPWRPKVSPYNGKGAVSEGFFVYIVELSPGAAGALDGDVTITLKNTAMTDVPMAYSAWAFDGKGWQVRSHSAQGLLPAGTYDPLDPRYWIEDPALRTLTVRAVRVP